MKTLRTPESQKKYEEYISSGELSKECKLCVREPLKDFKYWKIIINKFPYDRIAREHHMIVPKRHVTESDLLQEEIEELAEIKRSYLLHQYNFIAEASNKMKSIPEHFHLHLLII